MCVCVAAVSMLKRDRESLVKRVGQLETSLDQQINKLKVRGYSHCTCTSNIAVKYYTLHDEAI